MLRLPAVVFGVFWTLALLNGDVQAAPCPSASAANDENQMVVATYSVADLVIPVDARVRDCQTTEDTLMTVIRQAVEPQSWQGCGGTATVQYFPLGMALVVCQTPANQQRVADLLQSLRRLQDVEVTIEFRMVTLSSATAEPFMELAGFAAMHGSNPRRSFRGTFMNDRQLRCWMRMFQCDRETETMQVPRLTLFNGQCGSINVCDMLALLAQNAQEADGDAADQHVELGLHVTMLPVVSADRQFVRLHMDFTHISADLAAAAQLASDRGGNEPVKPLIYKQALEKTFVIPNGNTLACYVGKAGAKTAADASPADIRPEERELFLLATPRVVQTEEAWQGANGAQMPIKTGLRP